MSRMDTTKLNEIKKHFGYNPKTGEFIRHKDLKVMGTKNKGGYLIMRFDYKLYYLHRLAWLYQFGAIPDGWCIDHIDQDSANNKLSNLRCVPHMVNLRNQRKNKNNKTGCVGVYKHGDRWRARIKVDGTFLHLGLFDDFKDAVKTRKEAEQTYGFHSNHGT